MLHASSSMLHQSSPVSKTAFDSLQAKQSAVNAGFNVVEENKQIYNDLLKRIVTEEWSTKRQTPLVNAGYAARVRAISHIISNFVKYHRLLHADKIQIVLLGCGADVIGLWAASLDPNVVRVAEFDMADVCNNKREILCQQKLVEPISTENNTTDPDVLVGRTTTLPSDQVSLEPNYVLCPVDLREIPQLSQATEKYLAADVPTLAISELVLAYLAPNETNDLLRWCSLHLCSSPGSVMTALEPLGPEQSSSSSYISVLEGYKSEYCKSFGTKMDKGKSKHGIAQSKTTGPTTAFSPMASSPNKVALRFIDNGWTNAHATSLGIATSQAVEQEGLTIPETFDEHAALTLHLKAYSVVCAFANNTEELLKRLVCRWLYAANEIPPMLTPDVVYTYIEAQDEVAMRTLFYDTYSGLFGEYPAIRKMMSGVMNSDFSMETRTNNNKSSAIGERYKSSGGGFVVAVRYDKETQARQIVGCIGLRKCDRRDEPGTLEVFRLAVDSQQRGKGIGRTLMVFVETIADRKKCPKIIANTLTILTSALRLYEVNGYAFEKDSPLGALVMRTYVKDLRKS